MFRSARRELEGDSENFHENISLLEINLHHNGTSLLSSSLLSSFPPPFSIFSPLRSRVYCFHALGSRLPLLTVYRVNDILVSSSHHEPCNSSHLSVSSRSLRRGEPTSPDFPALLLLFISRDSDSDSTCLAENFHLLHLRYFLSRFRCSCNLADRQIPNISELAFRGLGNLNSHTRPTLRCASVVPPWNCFGLVLDRRAFVTSLYSGTKCPRQGLRLTRTHSELE